MGFHLTFTTLRPFAIEGGEGNLSGVTTKIQIVSGGGRCGGNGVLRSGEVGVK